MIKRLAAALVIVTITLPLHAGGFADVARAIDAQSGVKKIWIPFLGVARFAVRMVHPEGVKDFQLAVFRGAENVEPARLQQIMREKIGEGFTPLVQVWSKRKSGRGEFSFIYARPHGKDRIELVILAHDDEDTALVRVDVDAEQLARELDHPRGVVRIARR
jgi:hypothetical protein